MKKKNHVKPYLVRIKNWKVRNMVMLYLDARENFIAYHRTVKQGIYISFDKMRELCEIMYEIKEDHHLLYKRMIDPRKNRFENADKFMPDDVELALMKNVGLLFHKLMVARELKYQTEHYPERDEEFQRNEESLQYHLQLITELFEDGIEVLLEFILKHTDNILLFALLVENPDLIKKHFGRDAAAMIELAAADSGIDDIYCEVGTYYLDGGRLDDAAKMVNIALEKNKDHKRALELAAKLN